MGNVTIEHKNKKSDGVSTNNLLTGLLIMDRAKGDFTFTVAFAAYRQSMYLEMSKENESNENELEFEKALPPLESFGWRRVQCKPEATLSKVVASCVQLPGVEFTCW